MASIEYLKNFDKAQLFRFFVDGRFQRKYNGWSGYEEKERGSVQAVLNAFAYMIDNLQSARGLSCTYLLHLHRTCMLHVQANTRTSPGDIRSLHTALPFFVKTTTYEHIAEVLAMRRGDETVVFHDSEIRKTANELDAKEVFDLLQKKSKLMYKAWYPNLDIETQNALDGKSTLSAFYEAKHYVQMLIVRRMEEIVGRYNKDIKAAASDDEKLEVMALLVRELELLHPFADGNCRTFANVMLTQLLIYHGFPPAILFNPNLDGECSLAQWIQEIKDGMQRTLELLDDPTATVCNYSILDTPKAKRKEFLDMAAEVIRKIDEYYEIFLTPEKVQRYTGGYWINGDMSLRFTEVSVKGSYRPGSICFLTVIEDWIKQNRNIREEIVRRVNAGVRAFVIDDRKYSKGIDAPLLVVDEVIEALENTAYHVRREANPKTILITGTEGKTGSKIQMHHLVKHQAEAHAILNSANAGLPIHRSIADLKKNDRFELLEFSVDANEEKTLERTKRVNPDMCFFSNIGKEHMHVHKSIEGVIKDKSAVVEGLRDDGKCIVSSHLEVFDKFVDALRKRKEDVEILTYGYREEDNARLLDAAFDTEKLGWNIKADIEGIQVEYFLPLVQQHAPLMSVGILLAVHAMWLDVKQAASDYATLQPFESMGQVHKIHKKDGDVLFYDQSRRASISGVRSAFKDLQNFKVKGKIVALYGSISSVNLNEWTQSYHEELAQHINKSNIKRLYTTGANMEIVHDNLMDKSLLVAHSNDYDMLYRYIISDLKAGDLLIIQGYMRLNLDTIARRLLKSKDTSKFDNGIYSTGLSNDGILEYKKLLAHEDIEKGDLQLEISNRYELDEAVVKGLMYGGITYRQYREVKLVSFFENLDLKIESDYAFQCINSDILQSDYEGMIHNKEFCNSWFNNIDKIEGQPKKQLFGSYYSFGDKTYLLFVITGTTNLHIGIAKYEKNDGKYEILALNQDDHEDILNRFGTRLSSNIDFRPRKWGKRWVTIDCGTFIDVSRAEMFAAIFDFEHSDMYKEKFEPLLNVLSGRQSK